LIDGFLLSCRVENKSPATISFYQNILNKFQWFLEKFSLDTIDATTIRSFLGNLELHFFFFRTSAGIKKNRKNMKNINHNVSGGLRNARNERNDKKANALYLFISIPPLAHIICL